MSDLFFCNMTKKIESIAITTSVSAVEVGNSSYLTAVIPYVDAPKSFDFLWQLQNLLIIAEKYGDRVPAVFFDGGLILKPPDWILNGIWYPLMALFGLGHVPDLKKDEIYNDLGTVIRFPIPYNNSAICRRYEATGKLPFRWRVPNECTEWAKKYAGTIVITLRQMPRESIRNSNLPEWVKAAEVLRDRGERVVFVPDTFALNPQVGNFEVVRDAALDLGKRAALYAAAKANLMNTGGPGTLCVCMPEIPYVIIQSPIACSLFEDRHFLYTCLNYDNNPIVGSQWKKWHGFDRGEPGPNFRGPQQLWMWEEDNEEAIIRGYDAIMGRD